MRKRGIKHLFAQASDASPFQRVLILGSFAVVSAVLSNEVESPGFVTWWNTATLPALWFGLVLCIAGALWISRSPFELFALLVTSFVAWIAANQAAIAFDHAMTSQIISPAPTDSQHLTIQPPLNYLIGICGAIGGFVGSLIVAFGISLVQRNFRRFDGWAQTILLGVLAGCLAEIGNSPAENGLAFHLGTFFPMFLVWQVCVAGSIAYYLVPQFSQSCSVAAI